MDRAGLRFGLDSGRFWTGHLLYRQAMIFLSNWKGMRKWTSSAKSSIKMTKQITKSRLTPSGVTIQAMSLAQYSATVRSPPTQELIANVVGMPTTNSQRGDNEKNCRRNWVGRNQKRMGSTHSSRHGIHWVRIPKHQTQRNRIKKKAQSKRLGLFRFESRIPSVRTWPRGSN